MLTFSRGRARFSASVKSDEDPSIPPARTLSVADRMRSRSEAARAKWEEERKQMKHSMRDPSSSRRAVVEAYACALEDEFDDVVVEVKPKIAARPDPSTQALSLVARPSVASSDVVSSVTLQTLSTISNGVLPLRLMVREGAIHSSVPVSSTEAAALARSLSLRTASIKDFKVRFQTDGLEVVANAVVRRPTLFQSVVRLSLSAIGSRHLGAVKTTTLLALLDVAAGSRRLQSFGCKGGRLWEQGLTSTTGPADNDVVALEAAVRKLLAGKTPGRFQWLDLTQCGLGIRGVMAVAKGLRGWPAPEEGRTRQLYLAGNVPQASPSDIASLKAAIRAAIGTPDVDILL